MRSSKAPGEETQSGGNRGPVLPAGVGAGAGGSPDPTSSASQARGAALPSPTCSLPLTLGSRGWRAWVRTPVSPWSWGWRAAGDLGWLTREEQVCVDAVQHLGHGLGVVAGGVAWGTDSGAGQWQGACSWGVGAQTSPAGPARPGPLTRHPSSLASGPEQPGRCQWAGGQARVGALGQAGPEGPGAPPPRLTYEERRPGLDVAVPAVQVAEGLRQVDAELLLAAGHLAGGQRCGGGTADPSLPRPCRP